METAITQKSIDIVMEILYAHVKLAYEQKDRKRVNDLLDAINGLRGSLSPSIEEIEVHIKHMK